MKMMMRAWSVVFVGVAAAAALGQAPGKDGPAIKPAPTADPAAKSPEKPAGGVDAPAKPGFPPTPKKNIYANTDYRGRQAPEIKVEQWLTPAPPAKPAAPDRKGKVTLVDFWATWCPPCRRLIPELNAWQKEFKDDLVIIGISDEPKDKVAAFMANTPAEYAMAIDSRKNEPNNIVTTKSQIGVAGIPHVLVIDSTGIVRWQGFPQSEEDTLTTDVLKKIIAADRAQRGVKKSETPVAPAVAPAPAPSDEKKPGEKK